MISKVGVGLAGAYLIVCGYLIATQGLTGESFIALILGLPWSLLPSYFEYFGASGFMLYNLLLSAIFLNAAILYWVGKLIGDRLHVT